ncbi:MAG: hypothetical protein ACJ8DE_01000, partial [Microvirga sp.]
MIRGRIGALAAPATALPRRGQRLAYEAGGRAAPLRRPRRASSSLKVALKTILLAGVLVASGGGAFLSAQRFLPAGERLRISAGPEPVAAAVSPAAAPLEQIPAAWTSAKVEPEPAPATAPVQSPPPAIAIPAPPAAAPVAVPAPALAASPPAPAPEPLRQASAPSLPRDEIEGYLAKGDRMLKAGDIAAARLFFSRAAEAGEVRGALVMARSFDAETLRTLPVYGLQPNSQEAARWYAKAKDLGPTAAR